MSCTADVSPADKAEFREVFGRFRNAATASKASPAQVKEIQEKASSAVADGKVTREELRDLTAALKKAAP